MNQKDENLDLMENQDSTEEKMSTQDDIEGQNLV